MIRKRIAAGACALLLLTGCGSGQGLSSAFGSAPQWVDSDVAELVPADMEISPRDDFAAYANYDFIRSGERAGGVIATIANLTLRVDEMLHGEIGGSKGADELAKYCELMYDDEYAAAQGYAPLKEFTDDIGSIHSTQELYSFICDPERNPLGYGLLVPYEAIRSKSDPTRYMVLLMGPETSLSQSMYTNMTASEYEDKLLNDRLMEHLLTNVGYDAAGAKKVILNCYETEKFLAENTVPLAGTEDTFTVTREALDELDKGYPTLQFLDSWGYGSLDSFVPDKGLVKKADSFCTAHPDKVRDFLICRYLEELYICLDSANMDKIAAVTEPLTYISEEPPMFEEEIMGKYDRIDTFINSTAMSAPCAQLYCGTYITDEARTRLWDMTKDLIAKFGIVIDEQEWLSDRGKAAAHEKLDAMRVHVIDMDWDLVDYSGLNITSKAQGGSFVRAYADVKRFEGFNTAARLSSPYDINVWDPRDVTLNTMQCNSVYMPGNNGIYIFAGIVVDPMYHDGMTDEELLGHLGYVVGHEITHGFDINGVEYDGQGLKNMWLPLEDQAAFSDMSSDVGHYFSSMHPYDNCGIYQGSRVTPEAIADMGGIRLGLSVAKDIGGFDYDRYFRSVAESWQISRSLDEEKYYFASDEHPLAYLRINAVLTQFDEFYETYGVQEGDGMYTAPDKRVRIW